jgi:hypothetical protein
MRISRCHGFAFPRRLGKHGPLQDTSRQPRRVRRGCLLGIASRHDDRLPSIYEQRRVFCCTSCTPGRATSTFRSLCWHTAPMCAARRDGQGSEKPRFQVTSSSQIPLEDCAQLSLGYLNPHNVHIGEWKDRGSEGILFVPKAGETLDRAR